MQPEQLQSDYQEVQPALYGVALALDAFLVNGIQYGVLQQAVFPGFLEKTASNLLMTLTNLEQHGARASVTSPAKVREIQTALRAKCQQEIALVTALGSFRTLPPEQLHAIVSRIPLLREECAQLIQELEPCHRTPNPFYQTRPNHSFAAVNEFLTNLEQVFAGCGWECRGASN